MVDKEMKELYLLCQVGLVKADRKMRIDELRLVLEMDR